MAIKDSAVNLILQAKNLLSGEADAAADSVENLADSAEGLKDKLRALEDNGRLVKQFQDAEKAVTRTSKAWDTAGLKVEKLKARIEKSGEATDVQKKELALAEKALDSAADAYEKAEKEVSHYGEAMEEVGLATGDARKTQQKLNTESIKTKRALEDLGQGAGKAEKEVKTLNNETQKGTSRLAVFGKSLSSSASALVKWGVAAAAATAAASIVVLTRLTAGQADLARQALTTSTALGVSTDALQEWQYAAETVGVAGDKTADIFKDLSEKLGDAFLAGGGEAKEVIEGLGLSLEELIKLSPDQALLKISNELDKLGDQSGKVFVLETLASDASLLLPLLEKNAAGLKKLQAQARERGVLISIEDLKRLKETDDAFREIGDRLTQFKNKLASELAPTFKQIAKDFETFLSENPQLIDNISKAFTGLVTKTKEWVDLFITNEDEIAGGLKDIANTATFLGQSLTYLFRDLQAVASDLLGVFADTQFRAAGLYESIVEGLHEVGLADKQTVEAAQRRTLVLGQSVDDLALKADNYREQMKVAGEAAVHAFDDTGDSARTAGELINDAAAAAADLVQTNNDLADSAAGAAENTEKLVLSQGQLGEQIAATVVAIQAAQEAWEADPTEGNAEAIQKLRGNYAELQTALQAYAGTAETVKDSSLVENFQEASGAIAETAAEARKAKADLEEMGDSTKDLADGVEDVGTAAESSGSRTGAALAGIFDGWANRIASLSDKATVYFQRALGFKDAAVEAGTLQERLDGIGDSISKIGNGIGGSGITRILEQWARAGLETERSFISQQIQVQKLTDRILDGDVAMTELNYTTEDLQRRFSLLNDSDLNALKGAIASTRREMEQLADSIQDTIAASRRELASLQGDNLRVEELSYAEEKLELEQQLQYAKQIGDKQTIDNAELALRLAKEAHDIRIQNAKEQSAADAKREAEQSARDAKEDRDREREDREDISATEDRTQAQTTQVVDAISSQRITLDLQANGSSLGSLSNLDAREVQALIRAIENSSFLATG